MEALPIGISLDYIRAFAKINPPAGSGVPTFKEPCMKMSGAPKSLTLAIVFLFVLVGAAVLAGNAQERYTPSPEGLLRIVRIITREFVFQPHGLRREIPEAVKSETFRVTRVRAWTSAVAAKKASITPMGLPTAEHRLMTPPQASAMAVSMMRSRPSKRGSSSSWSHASGRDLRRPKAGARCRSAVPPESSPRDRHDLRPPQPTSE